MPAKRNNAASAPQGGSIGCVAESAKKRAPKEIERFSIHCDVVSETSGQLSVLGLIIRRLELKRSQNSDKPTRKPRGMSGGGLSGTPDRHAALHRGFRWQVDEHFNIA